MNDERKRGPHTPTEPEQRKHFRKRLDKVSLSTEPDQRGSLKVVSLKSKEVVLFEDHRRVYIGSWN